MANEARWPKIMRCNLGSPQETLKWYNHIDCLGDELLMEILLRLPNYKSVIQCKCVCKRWAAVASHPCFRGQFIGLKLGYLNNGDLDLDKEPTFAIVMHYKPDRICWKWPEFESVFRPSIFNAQESSFSPLHSCLGDDNASVSAMLVASCKDLLLYCKYENDKYDYYISNVQTKQWLVLPSSPRHYGKLFLVGFICDPFFSCDRDIVINAAYNYSVVLVRCTSRPSTKLSAHIFSSRCDSQWCERVLSLPKTCRLKAPGPSGGFCFCFDGKLYFSCCEGIFGFDHNSIEFDDEIQCHLVEWPVGMLLGNHQVGVSQENLYLSNYCWDTATLSVWVLKDYKKGNWMLQHRVETREWVSRDSWMAKKLEKFSCHRVLGFHPRNSDVIYVVVPGCILLCNLSTKMVELACAIPVAKKCKDHLNKFYNFPIIFQSLPTPLPPLAQSL